MRKIILLEIVAAVLFAVSPSHALTLQEKDLSSPKRYAANAPLLTRDDLLVLKKDGRFIFRKHQEPLLGGYVFIWLPASVDDVWKIVSDFDHNPGLSPATLSSKILEREGQFARVYAEYEGTWPASVITLETVNFSEETPIGEYRLYWKAIKTNLKDNFGFWKLTPIEGGTLVTYGVAFDLNWVPQPLAQDAARENSLKTLANLRALTTKANLAQAE